MPPPNLIVMPMDNLGRGDLGCCGPRTHRTRNLDAMPRGGLRLMTSGYPRRVNMRCGGHGRCAPMPDGRP